MKFKKLAVIVLALTLSVCAFSFSSSVGVAAKTTQELKDELQTLKDKQKELEKKVASLESDKTKNLELIRGYGDQITNLQEQIDIEQSELDLINAKISGLDVQIGDIKTKVDQLTLEIKNINIEIANKDGLVTERVNTLMERLRIVYQSGPTSNIELLLASESLTDLLISLNMLDNMAQYDNELIDKTLSDIDELENLKLRKDAQTKNLEATEAELQTKRDERQSEADIQQAKVRDIEKQRDSLERLKNKTSMAVANIEEIQKQTQSALEDNKDAQEKLDKEIQKQLANAGASSGSGAYKYDGAKVTFPVIIEKWYFSSLFGGRYNPITGNKENHAGVDITGSGINKKPVVAALAGKILVANKTDSWGGGYGYYVIIDHGDGMTTLYAHQSKVIVSVGQVVAEGQQIGEVGTTGQSTGPHLHFEVRYNGVRVDPYPYLVGS
jgi:murein DD-endopeptidase MepM/ murein hydrolase activator NlpD